MKKGFTLIELLAVILILAIIALIAIPVVTNIINDAKKHALKDSAYGIIDSADLYYAKNMKSITTNLEFDCSNNKCEASTNKLDFKGEVKEGKVKLFNDGKVSICIENETYAAYKNAATDEVTVAKGTCNYSGDEYTVDELVSLSDFNDMKAQYEAQIANLQEQANSSKIYSLGSGTSFDIKTLVPSVDYTKLTINNFIVATTTLSASTGDIRKGGSWVGGGVSISASMNITKSYDATTGILTAYSAGTLSAGDPAAGGSSYKGYTAPTNAWLSLGTID